MLCSEYAGSNLVYNHMHYKGLPMDHIPPQTHDVYEMIYIKTGDVTYSVEEKSYRIQGNSLILTRPGKLHILQFHNLEEYDRYDIFFEEDAVHEGIWTQIPEELDVISFGEDTSFMALFQKMDRYCKYFEGTERKPMLTNLVEQIIYELVIFTRKGAGKQTGFQRANPTVVDAIEYIDSHLHTPISLDALCRELYISKSYLHQLFMRYLQTSPRRYIVGKRLLAVQQAIRSGERPTDACARFGFTEYSSFYRAYRKQFGYPPSEETEHRTIREIEF